MMPQVFQGNRKQDTTIELDIQNGKLIIKNLETTDPEIVEYVSEQQADVRQEKIITAIRLGIISLKSNQTSVKTDYVVKELHKLRNEVLTTVQSIQDLHEESLGEDGTLEQRLEEKFEGFKFALNIKQAEDEIKNKTTLKGADFEKACYDIISKTAKINGDLLEDTTEVTGKLKACKKGDYLLTLSDCKKKITLDAKDVGSISATEIKKVLEGAIENREASYGILVVKSPDAVPKSIGSFNEIGNNMLVCAIGNGDEVTIHDELLLMALRYAKIRVMSQNSNNNQVDARLIQEKIGNIRQKIGRIRSCKTNCTNIEKSSKDIRNIVESIEDEINQELDSVEKSLQYEVEDIKS